MSSIPLKTPEEIEIMREGGKISALALKTALDSVKVGITLAELDKIAEKVILDRGAQASFKTVDDYPYTTCININEGVVHGIPDNYRLQRGDLVSIDLGALYKGMHTDLSFTIEVETNRYEKFLKTGRDALERAISVFTVGNRLGEVSNTIQKTIEHSGYSVSRELVGHGVGRELHEAPYVPGYGKKSDGPVLKAGMVFAIEVIYQTGKPAIALDKDGWTIKTADGSIAGLFEHTVALTEDGPEILTQL